MQALKKVFGISQGNSKLASNQWQERKQTNHHKEGTFAYYTPTNLDSAIFDIANFRKLDILYENVSPTTSRNSEICEATTNAAAVTASTGNRISISELRPPVPPRRRAKRRSQCTDKIPEQETLTRAKLPPPPSPPSNTVPKRGVSGKNISRDRLPSPPSPPSIKTVAEQQIFPLAKDIIAELKAQIVEKARQLVEAKHTIAKLKFNLDGKTRQLFDSQSTVEKQKAEILQKTQQLTEGQKINAEQEATISGKNRQLSVVQCNIAKLNVEIDEENQLLDEAQRIIVKLKVEETEKTSQLVEGRRNVEILMNEVNEKNRQLVEAQRNCERWMAEIAEKDRQVHETPRIIEKLKVEIAEKTQRLTEAERTIEAHGAFCSICLTAVANRMWDRCNHLAACRSCAETLENTVTRENRSQHGIACPKCRTHGRLLSVFI